MSLVARIRSFLDESERDAYSFLKDLFDDFRPGDDEDNIEDSEIIARGKKAGLTPFTIRTSLSKLVSSGALKRQGSWYSVYKGFR